MPAHIQTLCCYEFFSFIAVASGTVPGNEFLSSRRARAQPLASAREVKPKRLLRGALSSMGYSKPTSEQVSRLLWTSEYLHGISKDGLEVRSIPIVETYF